MPIDLYYSPLSASCRAVLMTAKFLDVHLNLKAVDLTAQEQLKPEIRKMNPQHTVPILNDSGVYISEGRAICAYLVNRYAKDDTLYPRDPQKRAVVDQRLYFDLGQFYASFANYYYPVIFLGEDKLDPEKKEEFQDVLVNFDTFLAAHNYTAGNHLTIADIALLASASNMEAADEMIFKDYSNIKKWMERCRKEIPECKVLNEDGAEIFGQIGKDALCRCSEHQAKKRKVVGQDISRVF